MIIGFLLVLTVMLSCFLHSCKREEWCSDCHWWCVNIEPLFGSKYETICAPSYGECEEGILEFLDDRAVPSCWECSEPRLK